MSRKCPSCKKWLASGQYSCPFCKKDEKQLLSSAAEANIESLKLFFAGKTQLENPVRLFAELNETNVPKDFCDLCVGCGARESVKAKSVLDHLVKLKCNTLTDVGLKQLLDSIEVNETEAAALEKDLWEKEAALKKKLLATQKDASIAEKEPLDEIRRRIHVLRDVEFLGYALSQCQMSAVSDEVKKKALLLVEQEKQKESAMAKNAILVEKAVVSKPNAGTKALREFAPPLKSETSESNKNDINANVGNDNNAAAAAVAAVVVEHDIRPPLLGPEGVNIPVDVLPSPVLPEVKSNPADDDADEICGDETSEKCPEEVRATLKFTTKEVVISGTLLQFVRSIECAYTPQQGWPDDVRVVSLKKDSRQFRVKLTEQADQRRRAAISFKIVWFTKLSHEPRAEQVYTALVPVSDISTGEEIVFPAPFTRPSGLVTMAMDTVAPPTKKTLHQSGEPGAVVNTDLLLRRMLNAISRLSDPAKAHRKRHLWTLVCMFNVLRKSLNMEGEIKACTHAQHLCYRFVNKDILSVEAATKFFTFSTPQQFQELVSINNRKQTKFRSQKAKLVTPEFCKWMVSELANAAVFFQKCVIPYPLEEALSKAFGAIAFTVASKLFNHFLTGVETKFSLADFGVLSPGKNLPMASFEGNRFGTNVDISLYMMDAGRAAQLFAFCMGRHSRLGADSYVRFLPKDVIKLIGAKVPRSSFEGNGSCISINEGQSVLYDVHHSTGLSVIRSAQHYRQFQVPVSVQYVALCVNFCGSTSFDRFLDLPDEVIARVFKHLPKFSRLKLAQTCSRLLKLAKGIEPNKAPKPQIMYDWQRSYTNPYYGAHFTARNVGEYDKSCNFQ